MENSTKSTATPSLAATLAHWARQGMESFVATQKILLDLTAQQNSLALGFVRERVNFSPLRPLTAMVDLAGQGMHVRKQSQLRERAGIVFPGGGMRGGLVQNGRQVRQPPAQRRYGNVVNGNRHRGSPLIPGRGKRTL